MASQADLGLSVEVVDIHRLPVRPEGVCHLFAFHPLQPLRVLRPDLLDPLRLLQRALPSDEGLRDTPAVDSLILASPLS